MRANSTILPFLAKALKGNADQEDGDAKLIIPNTFLNVIQTPEIFPAFITAPQNGTTFKSFIQSDSRLFNTTSLVLLNTLGPGLWNLRLEHWAALEGAVTDVTSICNARLVLNEGVGSSADVTRIVNAGSFQRQLFQSQLLIPAEQTISIFINTVAGLGTGTFRSSLSIAASRYL